MDDNDLRQYNEVLIVEGRKNGKTTETAAVEVDLLVNDGEGAPQIYNLATKLEQAKLGYDAVKKMVHQSPMLSRHLRRRVADIYNPMNLGFIKAMASNTSSLDGLDVHGATIDELAAIKNRDIYDLIKQAMGARSQPLLFTITTNGFIRGGIFDAQYQYACDILDGRRTTPGSYPSCTSWTTGTSGTSRSAGRKQTPAWALSRAGTTWPRWCRRPRTTLASNPP